MKQKSNDIEKKMIIGLQNDDHDSYKALFELYSKPLFQFSISYLKSNEAAEDVVQEVFLKVWTKRQTLRTDTSFKSYLFTIALNSIRKKFNELSKLSETKHDLLLSYSQDKLVFDDRNDYQILLNKLDQLIGLMPEKRRMVFIKKKFEEKSLEEIGQELNISAKTVEYHITEAMKFLKSEFGKLKISGLIFFHLFIKI